MSESKQAIGEPINLEVLCLVIDRRNTHGLRHGHYERYRQYCTRRLRRLRKGLRIKCGKNKFIQKNIDLQVHDPRVLEMLVMEMERYWSYAMQLKEETDEAPRKSYHMVRKYRKAAIFAKKIEEYTAQEGFCDPLTTLEANAYACLITGLGSFEQKRFPEALEELLKSRDMYVELSSLNLSSRKLYINQINEMEGNLRYCAVTTDTPLPAALAEAEPESITSKIEAIIKDNMGTGIEPLEEVIWSHLDNKQISTRVKMLSLRLKNIEILLGLEAVHADESVLREIEIQYHLTKSYRTYFIGLEQEENKKFNEAAAVYDKAIEFVTSAISGSEVGELELETFKNLITLLHKRKCSVKAQYHLRHKRDSKKCIPVVDRLDTYQEVHFDDGANKNQQEDVFIKFPKSVESVGCKPLFFDLALSSIPIPDIDARIASNNQSGVSGFVKGVFGWS